MLVDGSCYCGRIGFEAEVDPSLTSVCHCSDCQRLSGTTFRISANAPVGRFKLTRGTPNVFVKVAASGNRRVQAFCGYCGTALYATAADAGESVNIRVGTLRQRGRLAPVKEIWRRSALTWMPALSVTESHEEEAIR